jgi:hypothetical protein
MLDDRDPLAAKGQEKTISLECLGGEFEGDI